MSDKRSTADSPSQGRGMAQDGYQPASRGYQPVYTPSKPGAGHQPTGTGTTPPPPTTGSGVKPAPAKK